MKIFILRLTLIFASTAAYLGLAILGGGGFAAFFSHTALAVLAIALFALAGAAVFAGGNLSSGVREDRSNRWVIVALALIGLLAAYLPAYTDRIGFWTLDGETLRWLGVFLFAAGGALRLWPVFVLGARFRMLAVAFVLAPIASQAQAACTFYVSPGNKASRTRTHARARFL